MKRTVLLLLFILHVLSVGAGAANSVEPPNKCDICGMDRNAFSHSRMLIVYNDGTSVGTCSLHCAAADRQHNGDKQVSSLLVADYATQKLIPAETAVWVIGGKKRGVMTSLAKWAFATMQQAKKFMDDFGGTVNSFEQANNSATLEVIGQEAEEIAVESEMLHELK